MTLKVYTDAEFAAGGAPPDDNGPPVAVTDEVQQLVAAAKGWVAQVQSFAHSAPKEGLTRLLRMSTVIGGDRTVSVMNAARGLIGRAFPPAQQRRAYAACEALYHLCLHRVLLRGLGELVARHNLATPVQLDPRDRDGAAAEVLDEAEALAGLVQACAEVVGLTLATAGDGDLFPAASVRMGRAKQWAELVQGLAWIRAAARPGEPLAGAFPGEIDAAALPALPPALDDYIVRVQEQCIDCYCFMGPSSYFERVQALEAARKAALRARDGSPRDAWRTPNGRIIRYITEMATELAVRRAETMVYALCCGGGAAAEAVAPALRDAACALVGAVLGKHIDILFNRSVTLVPMAAVLTAAKWGGLRLKFPALVRLADATFGLDERALTFPLTLPLSARAALEGDEGASDGDATDGAEGGAKEGGPREFHNSVFIKVMELYRGEGDDDMAELFQGKGPALKVAVTVAAAAAGPDGGDDIALDYPPGPRRPRVKMEETPEPGVRKTGGAGLAGSAGTSNWTGGDRGGPPTSPRGGAAAADPGASSTRRPSAAKPTGKRALVAISGATKLAAKKKR